MKQTEGISTKGSSVYNTGQLRRGTAHDQSTKVYKTKLNFGNAYSSGFNSKMKLPPTGSSAGKYQYINQGNNQQ